MQHGRQWLGMVAGMVMAGGLASGPGQAIGAEEPEGWEVVLERVGPMSAYNQAAWWSPIVHEPASGVTYLSYLHPSEQAGRDAVHVARRDAQGQWSTHTSGGEAEHNIGHTQSSLALDGQGYLHVFHDMHNDPMRWRVSDEPGDFAAGFSAGSSEAFAGKRYTYPNLATGPSGDVYMIARTTGSGGWRDGGLYRYDAAAQQWERLQTFAHEDGATVYPNDVLVDEAGDVHLIWEWAGGHPSGARHAGSYARYSPESDRFYRADGRAYEDVPIGKGDADWYQPRPEHIAFSREQASVQSAAMTLDGQERPVVAYAYTDEGSTDSFEHRLARWDGEQWVRQTITRGPFSTQKSWVAFSDGVLRHYGPLWPDDPEHTGTDDLYLRYSTDLGQSWSEPIAITEGLDVQRPVGVNAGRTDYLYLPSPSGQVLYYAAVTKR